MNFATRPNLAVMYAKIAPFWRKKRCHSLIAAVPASDFGITGTQINP